MNLDSDSLLDIAWRAASAAGNLVRNSWQQPKPVEYKGAIDLVTPVDRESERTIVGVIRHHFPDHSILAEEETVLHGADPEHRWIVDPLDGTTNFAHGYPQFCISIAFERCGSVILGLVYDPIRQECFKATLGKGATLNDATIRTSPVHELDKALLGTGFPYDRREFADFYLRYFKAFMTRCQGIRRGGSAALDLCYVACGRLDGFWELKLKAWDIAAGALIVAEAGGSVSDFSGNAFTIWGTETLASNRHIHEEITQIASAVTHGAYVD